MKDSFEDAANALAERYPAYAPEAYGFMRDALDFAAARFCQGREDRHLNAEELYMGACACALDSYGPMAWDVLSFWGLEAPEDFGEVVAHLVEAGVFGKRKGESKDDFCCLPDLEPLLHAPYEPGPPPPRSQRRRKLEAVSRIVQSIMP